MFTALFINSQDKSIFKDVAVSSRILQMISLHSFYFFSASSGIFLNITHNGTQIPAANFVRRSMQVDEVVEALQKNGFNSLLTDSRLGAATSAADSSKMTTRMSTRNSPSLNSSTPSLMMPQEVVPPSCPCPCILRPTHPDDILMCTTNCLGSTFLMQSLADNNQKCFHRD
jgi:hypothetical protein